MTKKLKINKTEINNTRCFIVAELSANHNGKLSNLLKMIKSSKEAGADAVKIQAYEAEGITINSNKKYFKLNKKSSWKEYDNLFKLYKKAQTPKSWYKKIFSYAKKNKITLFASVFDLGTVDFLEQFNCPAYKIASPEIIDIPLLEKVAKTKKPIIISNGLGNFKDLNLAVSTIKKFNKNIIVLKCTSSYPAAAQSLNLKTMKDITKKFKCHSGFSDHTRGIDLSVYSAALGASMLEKHVVLKKNSKTVDSFFSIDFNEFKIMVDKIRLNEKAYGVISYDIPNSSKINLHGRKSLFAVEKIKEGEKFTDKNVKSIRPYHGLHPKYYKYLLSKRSNKNIDHGDPIKIKYVKK